MCPLPGRRRAESFAAARWAPATITTTVTLEELSPVDLHAWLVLGSARRPAWRAVALGFAGVVIVRAAESGPHASPFDAVLFLASSVAAAPSIIGARRLLASREGDPEAAPSSRSHVVLRTAARGSCPGPGIA